MTNFYKTKLIDKEICKINEYIKKKISFSAQCFCELIHGYLALQYFGDGYYKIGKNDKQQQLTCLKISK
jgi:hypothetical protein